MLKLAAAALAIATVLAGGQAAAQTPLDAAVLARPTPAAPVKVSLAPADAEAYALRTAGIARTSLDRKADDVTSSLGFLCGLQPGAQRSGAAAARGYDPNGRFLGAKLSLSFR